MPGTLPSQTEINHKETNYEQVKAVTLKSGKQLSEEPVYLRLTKNASKGGKDLQDSVWEQLKDPKSSRYTLPTGRMTGIADEPSTEVSVD